MLSFRSFVIKTPQTDKIQSFHLTTILITIHITIPATLIIIPATTLNTNYIHKSLSICLFLIIKNNQSAKIQSFHPTTILITMSTTIQATLISILPSSSNHPPTILQPPTIITILSSSIC